MRNKFPHSLKAELARNGCAVCGSHISLELHHIIPLHDAGPDHPSNLVALCANHHAMADRGIIPKTLLEVYKRLDHSHSVAIENVFLDMSIDDCAKTLRNRYCQFSFDILKKIFAYCRNRNDQRLAVATIQSLFFLVKSFEHLPGLNKWHLSKIKDLDRLSQHLSLPKTLQIEMRLYSKIAVAEFTHRNGAYQQSYTLFSDTLQLLKSSLSSEHVANTYTDYVSTQRCSSLFFTSNPLGIQEAERLYELISANNQYSDARIYSTLRAAECLIKTGKPEDALGILSTISDNDFYRSGSGIVRRLILEKDRAHALLAAGDRHRGEIQVNIARRLAEHEGSLDQAIKIKVLAEQYGVEIMTL